VISRGVNCGDIRGVGVLFSFLRFLLQLGGPRAGLGQG
jgi:hypothetical protein